MKISDYLESNVLSVLIRAIEYLQSAIHDSEKAAEDLFAVRAKNKELLTEALDLRDIEYLQSAIHDSEKAAEDLFAVRAKNKELLTEALDLRDKLLDLIELAGTWLVKEEK